MNWGDWFYYDETSPSCLRWKVDRWAGKYKSILNAAAGDPAGTLRIGYYDTRVEGRSYGCHRIVWEMHNGPIPEGMLIDHRDCDRKNNKIGNLRLATQQQNAQNRSVSSNNTSGHVGVHRKFTKAGTPYWQTDWQENLRTKSKHFSIIKLGEDAAKQAAIDFRNKKIEELNNQGMKYSELHKA